MTYVELCNVVRARLDADEWPADIARELGILHRAVLALALDGKALCEACGAKGKVQDKPCVHCSGAGAK